MLLLPVSQTTRKGEINIVEVQPDSDWCYLVSGLLPATEDAAIITRNEEIFVHKADAGDDTLVPREGSVDVSIREVPQ